jgi:hypothetical protein
MGSIFWSRNFSARIFSFSLRKRVVISIASCNEIKCEEPDKEFESLLIQYVFWWRDKVTSKFEQ